MMDSGKLAIRQKQIEVATKMINLNSEWQPDWKCLIYDTIGQNIIAPLLPMDELKNNNVVHHFSIQSRREAIPDVSAVYFVMPTDENIERICQDLQDNLYDSYYLNFISPITRPKLETIANAALQADRASNIKKVYDQYLNFIALEDDLFILREKEREHISYHAINRNDASDEEISNIIDRIVGCLFSLLVTMDTIPIIRCPKGGPAEVVAERLTKQIRETLRDGRNNLFNQDSSSSLELSLHRPLLCLVDRSIDMSTPLHHTWTYQALVHDLLNIELNRVQIKDDAQKVQFFDLTPDQDKFWRHHKGSPFPQVAEAVQRELDEYKKNENELTAGLNNPGDELAKISDAVKSLPELQANKSKIEKHTTIATAVLDQIKERKLDNFFELEEKIMNRSLVDQKDFATTLTDNGHPKDKYRLFLISYICDNPTMSDSEADKYMRELETFGCNRAAFDYVRSWKTFSRTNVVNLQSKLESSGGLLKTANMFSKLTSQASKFVMEGVKNLVLKEHYLPLTKIVDNLMDCQTKMSPEFLEYCYMDPMSQADTDVNRRKKLFQSAIVFVVGGGNYIEYQNLVEYSNSKSRAGAGGVGVGYTGGARRVIYGATDLLNGTAFLQELEQIGAP